MVSDLSCSVCVVGVGVVGSHLLLELAKRGLDVLGVDPDTDSGNSASDGGESRIIRVLDPAYDPRLLTKDRDQWAAAADVAGRPLFEPSGAMTVGQAGDPKIETLSTLADAWPQLGRRMDAAEVSERWPYLTLAPDDVAVIDWTGGLVRLPQALPWMRERARRAGAHLVLSSSAVGIADHSDHVEVTCGDDSVIRCRIVVVAAGRFTGSILARSGHRVSPGVVTRTVHLAWLKANRTWDALTHPATQWNTRSDLPWSLFPSLDSGRTVKVNLQSIKQQVEEPSQIDYGQVAADVTRECARLDRWISGVTLEPPMQIQTLLESYSNTGRPEVGWVDARSRIGYMWGFSGAGFRWAPRAGARFADEVAQRLGMTHHRRA